MEQQLPTGQGRNRKTGVGRVSPPTLPLVLAVAVAVGGVIFTRTGSPGPVYSAGDMRVLRAIEAWADPHPVTSVTAMQLMHRFFPGATMIAMKVEKFHGQPVYTIETDRGRVSVLAKTGHYWLSSDALDGFYAPDGSLLTGTGD